MSDSGVGVSFLLSPSLFSILAVWGHAGVSVQLPKYVFGGIMLTE